MTSSSSTADWSAGAAYVDGQVTPIKDAKIPITDWGYRRSDVTYDVVGVFFGAFFRLDDHLKRFRTSMGKLRMKPEESDEDIKRILTDLVRRTGLREAYVAMDCVRGKPAPGLPYHPAYGRAYLVCFAIPWVWLFSEEQQARGVHAMIAKTPRIPPESVDPTVKNFHWGDLTAALFEAHDAGADTAVLLDQEGYLTEGPGYNTFAVIDGTVVSPPRGALEGVTRLSVNELCDELGIPHASGRSRGPSWKMRTKSSFRPPPEGSCPPAGWARASSATIVRGRSRHGCGKRFGRSVARAGTLRRSIMAATS